MSNGNGEPEAPDEFGAGILAGLQREEAQAAVDEKLIAIDDALDQILQDIAFPVAEAIAAAQDESIALRAELGSKMAREQMGIEADRDLLEADLFAIVDTEVDIAAREAEALREPFVLPGPSTRPSEPALITGVPGMPGAEAPFAPPDEPASVLPGPTGSVLTISGTDSQLLICAGTVGVDSLIWVVFPGLGGVGDSVISLDPQHAEQISFEQIELNGGIVIDAWVQTVRVDGPPCAALNETVVFTPVYQSREPEFHGDFGDDACMLAPPCWLEGVEPEEPAEVPQPPPDGLVPPGPVDCLPLPDVVIALDCEARVLVVRRRGEIVDDPRFLLVGDALADAEFNLDELCAACGITGDVLSIFPPESRTPREGQSTEACRMPRTLFWPGFSQPDWANERTVLSLDSQAVERILRATPVLGSFLGAISPDIVAQLTLMRELRDQSNATLENYADSVCESNKQRYIDLVNARASYIYLNNAFPGLFTEAIRSVDQQAKEACPKDLPPPAGIVQAYLADEITLEESLCWLRGHGLSSPQMIPVLDAQRQKPTLGELITMLRRGVITEDQFNQQAREAGWLKSDDIRSEFAISELVPGPSDVIRMMVRDAADPNIDWTKSDATFTQKYRGQLKQWGEWQAIPEEAMKFNWRSHWEIPPAGQLFTMMHRIGRSRDGTIDPAFRDRVKRALEQNDLMPDWVDEVLAINFRLPRRADLRRVFRVGIFTEEDLMAEFVKQGLETDTARGLVKFEVREKKRAFSNNPLVAKFSRGSINSDELAEELRDLGADGDAIRTALDRGKLLMRMRRRDRCLEAIRHRVLIGEVDRAEAERLAQLQTLDDGQARELADTWICERDAKSKTTTAAELCKWYKDRVIDATQFIRQLRAIGYSRELAEAKFQQCQIELDRKLSAAQERERKRAQREADKLAAAARTQSRQSEAAMAARLANLEIGRKAINRREKKVADAAKTLANRNDLEFDPTLATMMRFYRGQLRLSLVDADELANAVLTAAQIKNVTGLVSWEGRVESILDAVT